MDLALEKYDASYLISPKYKKWEAKAMAENRTFYSVQKEIFDKSADIASREKIHEWEEKVQGLERGTFHSADVAAESNGWIYRYFPGEFKVGWTWRNAESTGMETGEGIDLNDASKPKPAKGTLKVANLKKNYEPSKNLGRPPWRY
jgi:hypothetical protein